MKYEEYQVWFHAYNTAISSLLRAGDVGPIIKRSDEVPKLTQNVIGCADQIAAHALEKFKQVDNPKVENMPSEFKNIVEQVAKEALKRGKP